MTQTVAIGGLGAIGLKLARALDAGVDGLQLIAVAARDLAQGRGQPARLPHAAAGWCRSPNWPRPTSLWRRRPPRCSSRSPAAAIEAGRIFVPASVGALLPRMELVRRAQETGARIVVPTGALLGLDAVRAAAEGPVDSVTIESRKPPRGAGGRALSDEARHRRQRHQRAAACVRGQRVRCGRRAFPPTSTSPRRWRWPASVRSARVSRSGPIPTINRNVHTIRVEAEAARFTMTIENVPSDENPRTGRITALSMLACLRGLVSTLKVGT